MRRKLTQRDGVLVLVVGLALVAACSARNPAYCDKNTPCPHPSTTICDLTGALGAKNSCVTAPERDGDGGFVHADAATTGPCAGVDCSSLDDGCNIGECDPDTGQCVANPVNEGNPCGEQITCSDPTCDGVPNKKVCPTAQGSNQTCNHLTCQQGVCTAGPPFTSHVDSDPENCKIPDGMTCMPTTYQSCGPCRYADAKCSFKGNQTCLCTTHTCSSGLCASATNSCVRFNSPACDRDTEGNVCGAVQDSCPANSVRSLCCSATGTCTTECGACVPL